MRRDERALQTFAQARGDLLASGKAMERDRAAFLAGWHAAMCARDEDDIDRPCAGCGMGMAHDDATCAFCGVGRGDEAEHAGLFHATAKDAAVEANARGADPEVEA